MVVPRTLEAVGIIRTRHVLQCLLTLYAAVLVRTMRGSSAKLVDRTISTDNQQLFESPNGRSVDRSFPLPFEAASSSESSFRHSCRKDSISFLSNILQSLCPIHALAIISQDLTFSARNRVRFSHKWLSSPKKVAVAPIHHGNSRGDCHFEGLPIEP